jgi:alkylhydroperoxidase family enzyme
MARIPPLSEEAAAPQARHILEQQRAAHGRVTNMKRTLAHAPTALRALMEWYPLRDEVAAFLGERLTLLFTHAISSQTDCLICSTFFRRLLIQSGEEPDSLRLDDREQAMVDYGRQLARDANAVDDALYARLAGFLRPEQIVVLTAFGGLMIATNVFNNALRVDLDEYLQPFQKRDDRRSREP